MWTRALLVLVAVATWQSGIGGNLLRNPSFEEEVVGDDWKGLGFVMERTQDDVKDGSFSLLCRQRHKNREGPVQFPLNVTRGKSYQFQGYFKILNHMHGKLWQTFQIIMQYNITTDLVTTPYKPYYIAWSGFASKERDWFKIEGSIESPDIDFSHPRLAIRGPDAGVDFLVDDLELEEVPEDPLWRLKANQYIEDHRKSNINFNVTLPLGVGSDSVEMSVSHKKHQFAFGTKVEDWLVTEEPPSEYFKLLKYLFNWATVQSYKWKFDKSRNPTTYSDFNRAIRSTDKLTDAGLKVRAHSVFWDKKDHNPKWLRNLANSRFEEELYKRLDNMMELGKEKSRVAQWDIQNEHIRHHYYEDRLNNSNITKDLFRHARTMDPGVPLFFNDYGAAIAGTITKDMVDLAEEYLSEGVPLDGLGLQSHLKDFVLPSPTAIWRRLDKLQATGLDLVVTELDILWPDVVQRADIFEDVVRTYFAHPGVSGLFLWGFCDRHMREPAGMELVHGDDLQIVEPGRRWACLVKKEWTTKEKRDLRAASQFTIRGFKGEYELVIKRNGIPVERHNFTLGDQDLSYTLAMTSNTDGITLPEEEHDYVPECISHRAQQVLGEDSAHTSQSQLTCVTRGGVGWSGRREDDTLSVTCERDEVMTGCSSLHKRARDTRKGEMLVLQSGQFECRATQGRASIAGVRPYARCCKVEGLSCEYMRAGPSSHFDGAKAEVQCDVNTGRIPLGCSSYSQFPDFDGSYPNLTASTCLAHSGPPASRNATEQSGSVVSAACCTAPGLQCQVKYSRKTSPRRGSHRSVSCDHGWTLTGCNVLARHGHPGGAKVVGKSRVEYCLAYMGRTLTYKGAQGAVAVATCCTINDNLNRL